MSKLAKIDVTINDEQIKARLNDIKIELQKIQKIKELALEKGDLNALMAFEKETKKLTREFNQLNKQVVDVDKVLKNLSGSSIIEIEQALSKANAEFKKMKRNDPGFADKEKQVKLLRTELDKTMYASKQHQSGLARLADGFNKYFAMGASLVATFTGVIFSVKKAIEEFNNFEERLDNLSALTGLAGVALDWLSDRAKALSTATLESGIRVKQSATEIIDAFTKTGSARPELLANKEALSQVTEEAIILANASKTELQPAIEALTMVMNQYNVPASEARRIINSIAAGSKAGAGEIPYITTAFEKAGTVAADAGISIETLVATIETLAPRITQPEIAGRSLKGVLLDLQTTADDTNPAMVGLATALENLSKKQLSITELTKLFGAENITTAKILINNVDELRKYEAAVTGTNVAIEQAAINTDNNNAKLAQAKNRLNLITIELGGKLAPAFTMSTNAASYLIKSLAVMVDFFTRFGPIIITATAAVVGYTVAVKISAMWEARLNKERLTTILLTKLQTLLFNAQFAAIALYNSALALLQGKLAVATIQFRAFSAAMMANPIGLIVGGIMAIGVAVYFLSARLTEAQKAQKVLNDINLEARKNIVAEKMEVERLIDIAQDEFVLKEKRIEAIKKLNEISPEYLGTLTLEKINTDAAKKAIDSYIASIEKKARVQAATEKLVEIEKELLDLQSGKGTEPTFWQELGNTIAAGGQTSVIALRNVKTEVDNLKQRTSELALQKEKLLGITKKEVDISNTYVTIKEEEEITETKLTASIEAQIGAYNELTNEVAALEKQIKDLIAANKPVPNTLIDQLAAKRVELQRVDETVKSIAKSLYEMTSKGTEGIVLSTEQSPINIGTKPDDNSTITDAPADRLNENELQAWEDAKFAMADATQNAIFEMIANKQRSELDEKLSMLDEQRLAELSNAELTEEQKFAINEKYNKKNAALQLAAWKKEKAANVVQSIMKTALAVLTQLAGGDPYTAIPRSIAAGAMGLAQTAVIVAQKPPQFKSGGYTDDYYNDDKPAGTVHVNEFVANAQAKRNPTVRPVLDIIDYAQRSGTIRSINLPAVLASSRGYKDGGYVIGNGLTDGDRANLDDWENDNGFWSKRDPLHISMKYIAKLSDVVDKLDQRLESLEKNGISGKWVYQDFKSVADKETKAISKTN